MKVNEMVFNELIRDSEQLRILIKGLVNATRLDYTGKGLTFTSEAAAILKAIAPADYDIRLRDLMLEEEVEHDAV